LKRIKYQYTIEKQKLICEAWILNKPRKNWEKQFADSIKKGFKPDNKLCYIENDFEKKNWTW
jgi:hypothetical protein